jgi:hypothetical protein
MTLTPGGFERNVTPLLDKDTHPLVRERINLCAQLGAISLDIKRYNSQEWFGVIELMRLVTQQIRQEGVDTSRFHDSSQFPTRYNPAAAVIRGETPIMPTSNTPPTEPAELGEVA